MEAQPCYGILGGGQLALMLMEDGLRDGFNIRGFVNNAAEPWLEPIPIVWFTWELAQTPLRHFCGKLILSFLK